MTNLTYPLKVSSCQDCPSKRLLLRKHNWIIACKDKNSKWIAKAQTWDETCHPWKIPGEIPDWCPYKIPEQENINGFRS